MELRHLRYFRVVAEELHFGRAAARLHMEPQPLHFQMKQLERELGFPLFTHRKRRTELSAAGEALLGQVEHVLGAVERAVETAARAARGEVGTLRIGYLNPMIHHYLVPAIERFREQFPAASFDLRPYRYNELYAALGRGEVDIGLLLLPVPDAAFASAPLLRFMPRVAVPASDPLAARTRIEWSMLQGRPAIAFDADAQPVMRAWADGLLERHGVTMNVVQTGTDIEHVIALAGIGIGVALVPLAPLDQRTNVAFVPLPRDAGWTELGAVWLDGDENALRDRFVDVIRDRIASLSLKKLVDA